MLCCTDPQAPSDSQHDVYSSARQPTSIAWAGAQWDSAISLGVNRRVSVRVLDRNGRGIPGVPIRWRVLSGGGSIHPDADQSTEDGGLGSAVWQAGLHADEMQVLEVASGGAQPLRLQARSVLSDSAVVAASSPYSPSSDTVGALLSSYLRVNVRLPDGRPVIGALVNFSVETGGGSVSATHVGTDSLGFAAADWQLGPLVGEQRAVAFFSSATGVATSPNGIATSAPSTSTSGGTSGLGTKLAFSTVAAPGQPAIVAVFPDTLILDALAASTQLRAKVTDRFGNPADSSAVRWSSLDSSKVVVSPAGIVRAMANGSTSIQASVGAVVGSSRVTVAQVPVRIQALVPFDTINRLGDTLQAQVRAFDRLGAEVSGLSPTWRSLNPGTVELLSGGRFVVRGPGTETLEATVGGVTSVTQFQIRQVIASLASPAPDYTVQLDNGLALPLTAKDSNGFLVPQPSFTFDIADPTVIEAVPSGTVTGLYPGHTTATVMAGTARLTLNVTVKGVVVTVDGQRRTSPGQIVAPERIELSNGRVRVSWTPHMLEPAAVALETRVGAGWVPGTAVGYGDWLFPASSVVTQPTEIELLQVDSAAVAVRLRFGNHQFDPVRERFPSSYLPQPYPFSRVVWLRPEEYGYFTQVSMETPLLNPYPDVEHEVGFGGLWGPASISTSEISFRTDTLQSSVYYNSQAQVDAAEFLRDGDQLVRVLVPLQAGPFVTPVFPGWGYGSVYVHNLGPMQSYGAYLYAAPAGLAQTPRTVCGFAWATAPFTLPSVSSADLAGCGPQ